WRAYRRQFKAVERELGPQCKYFFYAPILKSDSFPGVWKYQIDAMWAQLEGGVPTVNGYSGNVPPGWTLGNNLIHRPSDEVRIQAAVQDWVRRNSLTPRELCFIKIPAGPWL
ncbi:MAG TPA: hypothetical protein VF550_09760, partial [Polyangia bacterium]